MALKSSLPLDPIVNIMVNVSTISALRRNFDQALLIGMVSENVNFGDNRVKTYDSLEAMLQDGFTATDRLYKAAQLLLNQSKRPPLIAIGKIMTTEDKTETPLETLQACRQANSEWYPVNYCGDLTDEQILAIADYVEAAKPTTLFTFTTAQEACLNSEDNIFAKLKAKKYRRTFGQFSTAHPDAVCGIIGWAMGAMSTDTIDSSFSLAYKREIGVDTENTMQVLSTSQVNNIKNNYGNIYINRGQYYDGFEEGTVFDGSWFDEIVYLDKYQNDMQLGIMDLLSGNNKIPQTEAGMTKIKDAIKVVCDKMNRVGFISSGEWLANDMLELKKGDVLPNGYLIQSETIDSQSQADRDARKAPPIYVALKLTGAIHHVTVQVDVNR